MKEEVENIDFESLLTNREGNVVLILTDIFNNEKISSKFLTFLEKKIKRGGAKKVIDFIEENQLNKTFPQLLSILAKAYEKSGNKIRAAQTYFDLFEINKDEISFLYNAAKNYFEAEKFNKAEALLNQILEVNNHFPEAYYLLASIKRMNSEYKNAIQLFEKSLSTGYSEEDSIYYNIGVLYEKLYEYEKALEFYDKAININPGFAEAHWNKSLILLRFGRYGKAWEEFEWRKRKKDYFQNLIQLPECENLTNASNLKILFYEEQGFGDSIQFLRFVKYVNAKKIGIVVRKALARLFEASGLFDAVFIRDEENSELKNYDCKISLLSLPFLLNAENVSLASSLFDVQKSNVKLTQNRVGIFWRGNANHENDKYRSIKLAQLLSAFENCKCEIYSFEPTPTEEEKAILSKHGIIDLSESINDFFDTAKLLPEIDLLVSVDTAIVHLALTLKINTLLLLPKNSDWRWQDGKQTDWYNNVEMFIQDKLGNWNDVLKKVSLTLKERFGKSNNQIVDVNETAEIFLNNALHLFSIGKMQEGLKILLEAYNNGNESNEIIFNIALAYHKLGQLKEARKFYEKLFPDVLSEDIYYNYLLLLLTTGELQNFERNLDKIKSTFGNSAKINFLLGKFFVEKENFSDAIKYYTKAISLSPSYYYAWFNLASVFYTIGEIKNAKEIYIKLLTENKDDAELHYNLGLIFQEEKEFEKAEREIITALSIEEKAEYKLALSEVKFSQNKFEEGFDFYDARFKINPPLINPRLPEKLNELENKNILIFEEQGIGDTIQFIRFVIPFAQKNKISVAVRDSLVPLFEKQKFIYEALNINYVNAANYDYSIPVVSLFPLYYKVFRKIFSPGKYIDVDEKFSIKTDRPKIAIAWRGNPFPVHQRKRHLDLKRFENLFAHKNLEFYLLQKELNNEEFSFINKFSNVIWEEKYFTDFYSIAKLMNTMDLIISIDTVFLHLAGALGKKSIGLLHYSPDWRWGSAGEKTKFYPSAILLRQKEYGNWDSVISELENRLLKVLEGEK